MSLARAASIRHLATFHTVARFGSVTLAAEELHLSQSAVSIQLANLEEAAGTSLMLRTGRGLRLTEAGELLLNYAERLLALWNEASDEMASHLGAFSGSLRVGAVTTAEYWLPRLLVTFVSENPRVKINLHVANREDILRKLVNQDVDVAVTGHPPNEMKLAAHGFAKNPMGFMAAPHHPLMAERELTLATLAKTPLLVRERGSGSRNTLERIFREAGLRLRVGSEFSSNESIKQMCAAGFGPAYLSIHTCVLEMNAGLLKMLPLPNNPIEREWYVVRLPTKQVSSVALAFERFLREKGQDEIHRQVEQRLDSATALTAPAARRNGKDGKASPRVPNARAASARAA
jgi:DNA-binding transcriptional LysR family regulator